VELGRKKILMTQKERCTMEIYKDEHGIEKGTKLQNIHTREIDSIKKIEDVENYPQNIRVYEFEKSGRWNKDFFWANWRLMRTSTETY